MRLLMATKAAALSEKIYECEVKRRRLRAAGSGYEPFWKVKNVQEALIDGDTEFRCKDCHGAVKLVKRNAESGRVSHVEHKLRGDSEHCISGVHFRATETEQASRLSSAPVH